MMGVATPLPVGVHTSGVVCLARVGVCITGLAILLCGVVSSLDWELFTVDWGVDMPPWTCTLARGVLLDNTGILGRLVVVSLLG